MRSLRRALLVIAGLGLTSCVGVGGQPYGGTFSGNSAFVTPYRYPNPSSDYLYDQSHRSWQRNTYRPPVNYRPPPNYRRSPNPGQSRGNNPNRNNPPGHNNPPGRGNGRNND